MYMYISFRGMKNDWDCLQSKMHVDWKVTGDFWDHFIIVHFLRALLCKVRKYFISCSTVLEELVTQLSSSSASIGSRVVFYLVRVEFYPELDMPRPAGDPREFCTILTCAATKWSRGHPTKARTVFKYAWSRGTCDWPAARVIGIGWGTAAFSRILLFPHQIQCNIHCTICNFDKNTVK